jgi:hypothetical protein
MGLRGPGANPIGKKLKPRPRRMPWKPHFGPVATPPVAGRERAELGLMGAALRQRRHRERERAGRFVVNVELDGDDLKVLIEARLLDPRGDCHTREAIATAVRSYLRISRNA